MAAGLVLTVSSPAAGLTTTCDGDLAPGSYLRVVVPEGAFCSSAGPVTIAGGVWIGAGATLVLGSEENAVHTATINGGVHATDASSVQVHFSTINGGIDVHGGSGAFGGPFGVTWNTIEDSTINGRVAIEGYDGFWMGFIRNTVNGSVDLNGNVLADPDGNEYVTNRINGSLNCADNSPAPQVGDSEGELNVVTGQKTGQCADV
ncbi:MAG TPA: hypothetical protein VFB42_02550 [Gaiellaceae bacterium]|nr:hypothetical protein [Gaiellaceae bacterium]